MLFALQVIMNMERFYNVIGFVYITDIMRDFNTCNV